ncbi:MurR/RpiR family transcriptional regulator [Ideonella azotifigens]|uniref:MurR/RpiR family transcriptional regulator n=1 Tax=Ideonella azotifigens TaxID=513160 RepID=A0ABN1K7I6_9BURK|nr:MurR/RpiR family transcriptional regulator [Ideonella azotifigens]MCD2342305.1 MurR/RpiR family transcriptional regulator [Ideonella azotifigens]
MSAPPVAPAASPAPAERAQAESPVHALLQRIAAEYPSLSKQLKQIAQHVEQHSDHLGLEKIQDVAARCGVQPSAVVRFAKHFGFSGYSELQKLFRDGIAAQIAPTRNYQARIREVIAQGQGRLSSADIAYEFIAGAIAGMNELQRDLHGSTLGDAVELLAQAPAIWVVGARRSFPVATYLAYALQHTDKPVQLVTGMGAMHEGQLRSLRRDDVMIAISFAPYAQETTQAAEAAAAQGARLIAITDSRMGPLAALALTTLVVNESSTFGFRGLTNVMALAQSLFIALAYRLELDYHPAAGA